MKILITTDWYSPVVNGVVTSVLNLEKYLREEGHEVRILTLSPTHRSYKEGNVTYISSLSASMLYDNARFTYILSNSLISELINFKPDVIHTQSEFSTFLMAKRIQYSTKASLVHTYHTVYEDYVHYVNLNKTIGKNLASYATKTVLRSVDLIIAPTNKVKNLLLSYDVKNRIAVLPTGIEVSRFISANPDDDFIKNEKKRLNIGDDKAILISLGRIAKEKNIQETILYLKNYKYDNFIFLIVGGGPYEEELKELVKKENLEDKVIFTGMVSPDKVPYYYKLADVFISASTSEAQGLTYIEALSSSLVIFCKEDESLEDVLIEGVNGYYFHKEDDFLQKLEMILSNKENLAKLKENALNTSYKFSAENFAHKASELYSTTLQIKTLLSD